MTRYIAITLTLLSLGMQAGTSLAQTTAPQTAVPQTTAPQTTAPPTAAPIAVATVPSEQDLKALNFYLGQKDQASADAELRRLKIQFPAWVPSDDPGKLVVTQPSTEIDTIYRQIAAGQLAEARATITATQSQYPGWVVPVDMTRLLETAEGQLKLDAALEAGNATEALQIAAGTDGLLRCDRVNNPWRIAKAQEAQQAGNAAVATYTGILNACTNFPDITATLEKSDTVTSNEELSGLFAIAQSRFPDQSAELTALQAKLLAGRGAAPQVIAIQTGKAGATVPRTGATEAVIPKTRPLPRLDPAADKPIIAPQPNAPAANRSTGNSGQGQSMSPAQCLAATQSARSAATLAQRGWCAYNLDRPLEALSAFQSAEVQLGGAPRRDARFGLALSYLKLNMTEEASRVAAATDFTHQQRVETESIILNQRGVLAYKKRQYAQSIGYFDALEQMKGTLPRDLSILRGFAYVNAGNKAKARAIFLKLNDQLATAETMSALRSTQ